MHIDRTQNQPENKKNKDYHENKDPRQEARGKREEKLLVPQYTCFFCVHVAASMHIIQFHQYHSFIHSVAQSGFG